VVETLIGSAIAVLAVLVSPSAPAPERVVSDALTPLRRCRDILREIGPAIGSAWTLEQAQTWRPAARPMPAVGAMLVSAASAIEAYAVWVPSPGESADRKRLSDAIRVAGETLGQAVARAQRRWRDDPGQWLTFGTILAMSQRILAEVSSPLDSPDEAA
jgi:hypothetical protein